MKKSMTKKIAPYFKTFSSAEGAEMDYIIQCHEQSSCQKLSLSLLKNIGTWSHYGKTGFRGWSSLTKNDIVAYICQHADLNQDEFRVFEANASLFMIK